MPRAARGAAGPPVRPATQRPAGSEQYLAVPAGARQQQLNEFACALCAAGALQHSRRAFDCALRACALGALKQATAVCAKFRPRHLELEHRAVGSKWLRRVHRRHARAAASFGPKGLGGAHRQGRGPRRAGRGETLGQPVPGHQHVREAARRVGVRTRPTVILGLGRHGPNGGRRRDVSAVEPRRRSFTDARERLGSPRHQGSPGRGRRVLFPAELRCAQGCGRADAETFATRAGGHQRRPSRRRRHRQRSLGAQRRTEGHGGRPPWL
mmetsp:Transcript_82983/g.240060  ORF Transcript_82983/g.240060 Transcript_82983/m.240060 type:complete len:268 (+) Transcript_82983:473-1276(+)